VPDFTQYVPPGVYVEEETTPLVSIVGATPSVVGIVGPAIGYRLNTEAVTLTGTGTVTLKKLGINTVTGFEVRAADGTLYVGGDYALVQTSAGAAGTQDDPTTIARSGGSNIPSGSTVYVTYRYTDTYYAQPFEAQDYDTVKEVFGEPINLTTGAIISPLALAAKVAFENGAAKVVLVATPTPTSATREELQAGLAKLSSMPDVNIVVPLPVGLTGTEVAPGDVLNVGNDLQAHVEASSDNDKVYRVGVLGYETTVTNLPTTIASSVGSQRVMLAWPNKLLFYNGFANQVLTIAGYYLAAAYAGRMAALDPQTPLTRKQIRGFAGIPADVLATMTVATKNSWSSGGVAVAEYDRNQRLVVRHGTSTLPTSVMTREISLVRARDSMMSLISDSVDGAGLIGSTIDSETPVRIKGVIQGCLETLLASGTIAGYTGLKVRQTSADPTVIEVKFQYQPAYPLNYITVVFSVNALTGELAEAA
jgi:hypothetical protein